MAEVREFARYDDYVEAVQASGLPYSVIGHSPRGQEIFAFELGGHKEPAILITSGSHADEPSGPLGALTLLKSLSSEHKIRLIPMRDPFAWEGFDRCLGFALGYELDLENHDQAEQILRNEGTVHFQHGGLLITEIGGLCFALKRPSPNTVGPREIWALMQETLPNYPEVITALQGKRIILPSNLAGVEGCGLFSRAYTVFVTPSGQSGNLNRFFDSNNPPHEVACVQKVADEIRPGLLLDLHEGVGSDYYIFTSGGQERDFRVARAAINSLIDAGHQVSDLSKLMPGMTPSMAERMVDGGPGIIVSHLGGGDAFHTLSSYCFYKFSSIGFTTETGRWNELSTRVKLQEASALAAIAEFESWYR